MNRPAGRRRLLAILVVVVVPLAAAAPSCKRAGTARDERASPVTASDDATPAELALAARWIDGLRAKDGGALAALARAPFDFRDARTGAPKASCADGVRADAAAVATLASCLVADPLLKKDLAANPAPRIVSTTKDELPPWAKPWAGQVRAGLRPISVFIHGPGSSFELILLVAADGVHAFWQNVFVEPS
jgi:hypothetical protein